MSWIIAAVLLALFFRQRKNKLGFRLSAAFCIAWIVIILLSPLPCYLTEIYESEYPVYHPEKVKLTGSRPDIVILGAGYSPNNRLPATQQISQGVLTRLVEGIRIYRKLEDSRIVTSGHYSKSKDHSQGKSVAEAAVLLGVPPADTAYLPTTRTTEDEALSYSKKFGAVRKVILVTDATHLKRAVYLFEKHGLEVIPAPANFKIKKDPFNSDSGWGFSYKKITLLRSLIKEKLGYWYARF